MKQGRREALILGAAGAAAATAGFLVGPILLGDAKRDGTKASAGVGNLSLLTGSLLDLEGRPRRLSEWQARILVCNFWATWCAPCREEIPLLMAAREKYATLGLEIVGIAIDNTTKVIDFTTSFKISYPVLLAEADGLDMMRKLGNSTGGLPYTVIADRQGGVLHRKLGAFHSGDLDVILGPLSRT